MLEKIERTILIFCILLFLFLIGYQITIGVIRSKNPIFMKYDESFIIGNTAEAIQEKYGEFSLEEYTDAVNDEGDILFRGAYLLKEGADIDTYYCMTFEDGKVVETEISERGDGHWVNSSQADPASYVP
ncbi:MAG: hypothetical protein IJ333_08755 [Clostridia bacterium]|nr:hypothetical protein [Clostridia bacterium]